MAYNFGNFTLNNPAPQTPSADYSPSLTQSSNVVSDFFQSGGASENMGGGGGVSSTGGSSMGTYMLGSSITSLGAAVGGIVTGVLNYLTQETINEANFRAQERSLTAQETLAGIAAGAEGDKITKAEAALAMQQEKLAELNEARKKRATAEGKLKVADATLAEAKKSAGASRVPKVLDAYFMGQPA